MFLLNFIFFFILIFLVFYFPGRLLLRITGYKFDSFTITFSSSLVVGIAAFLLGTYLLSWFKFAYLYNLIIPIALVIECKNSFKEIKQRVKIKEFLSPEAILILVGSIMMVYLTWRSGTYRYGELLLYGVNSQDSIFHLSIVGSLMANFPPFHPGLAGISLRGYHIFYDFLIANFANFYHLNIFDLFFRFFSLFNTLLYGATSLTLARFLKWKKTTALLFIFLMYFIQSFDYFADFIYKIFNYTYNSSGIIQSSANILEQGVILSISFVFIGFILVFNKRTKLSLAVIALVLGVIAQISIYSSVLFYTGLAAIAVYDLFKKKETYFFKSLIFSGIISALVYLPLNFGAGELVFAPLDIYKHFINSAWIFINWHWNVNFITYLEHKNYLHLAYFYSVAISIFLITSLGVRILIVLDINKLLNKKFYNSKNIFWASSILFSFIIPSFFIQSVSVYSIIHFFWIGYILLSIPTALVLGAKLERSGKYYIFLSFLILSILFLPDLIKIVKGYSAEPSIFGSELVKQSKIMSQVPQNEGIIVLNRTKSIDKYVDLYNIPLFSALSSHSIYFENEVAEFKGTGDIINQRKNNIDKIVENVINCKDSSTAQNVIVNVMKNTKNKYLLILNKNNCTQKFNKLKIINEGDKTILYRI